MRWMCKRVSLHCFVVPIFGPAQSSGSLPPSLSNPSLLGSGPSYEWGLCPQSQPPNRLSAQPPRLFSAQALAHAGPKHSSEPLTPLVLEQFDGSLWSLRPTRNEGLEHIEPDCYASNNKCLFFCWGHKESSCLKGQFTNSSCGFSVHIRK